MPYPANTLSLVADVGGTNTRVALADGDIVLTETVEKFKNTDFSDLESVLAKYVVDKDVDCKSAAAAIAGPVRDGRGTLTNLDWSIDSSTLARATRAEKVAVLNDLQAQGYGVELIASEKLRVVHAGAAAKSNATRLVIGVGTGFNAAPVYKDEGRSLVPPSESGHVNLPVGSEEELRLSRFLEKAHGFAAVEDALSGRGLENLYAWRASESGNLITKTAADIMAACETGTDPIALEAAHWFARILGTVSGNLALIYLPFGGIYLIGGVARAVSPYLQAAGFADQFTGKGRFSEFVGNFPVSVIEDDYAALTGLATYLNHRF